MVANVYVQLVMSQWWQQSCILISNAKALLMPCKVCSIPFQVCSMSLTFKLPAERCNAYMHMWMHPNCMFLMQLTSLTRRTAMVQQMLLQNLWLTSLATVTTQTITCHVTKRVTPHRQQVACMVWKCKSAKLLLHQRWYSTSSSQRSCICCTKRPQTPNRMQLQSPIDSAPSSALLRTIRICI